MLLSEKTNEKIKMDMTKYVGENYLTAEKVKEAKNKKIVLLNTGKEVEGNFGKQVQFEVQLAENEDVFLFTPYAKSINVMIEQEGHESTKWVGKVFNIGTDTTKNGKEIVVVVPKE